MQRFRTLFSAMPAGGQFLSSAAISEALGTPEQKPAGFFPGIGFRMRMLGRRCKAEFVAEWPLFKRRLLVIIPLLIFQYVHAIFTGMAYYMHEPLSEENATLHDLGFEVLPFLSVDSVSEIMVYSGFAMFAIWILSPFVTARKTFHAAVVLKRVLVILVLCQILRILTFLSTQLPAPAPHCRRPESTSNADWPVWWKVIIVNVSRQASKGCGDLIFSSHLTFLLTFTWTYAKMGQYILLKIFAFAYTFGTALAIIASRKHYTVDVTVALYVVPLLAWHLIRRWTTFRNDMCTADNRSIISLNTALPVVAPPPASPFDGGADGSSGGSKRGGGAAAAGAAAVQQQRQAAAADLESGGLHVELSHKSGSGGVLGAIADLPRRMSSRTQHRRTDSSEPVLLQEGLSSS